MVLRLKRRNSSHKFEDSNPKCPQVNHLIISSSLKHLRSPIVGSSSESQHLSFPSSFFNFLADSKINEFDGSVFLIIEDVIRFDISVAYFIHVDVLEGF